MRRTIMIRHNHLWITSFFLLLLIPFCVFGKDIKPTTGEPHKIPEITEKIKIDGVLDDAAWKNALVLTLDYEVEPGENIPAPVKTEVLLLYSKKHIYVAFRAYDPNPSQIRSHVTDRDNIDNDDSVGIVLDTFNDSRFHNSFFVNPHGVQSDNIYGVTHIGFEWDAIWNSAAKVTKDGYHVEMAIPFTSLRFQGKKGDQVWGFDAVRNYPRSLKHTIGVFPRDWNNNCYMCQAIKIKGFSGAKPGNNLEFDPTLSAGLTQEREEFPNGDFEKKNSYITPGITARWSFTPNMTLSATINPDFSQVEADAAQLDINNQFALYYAEKRPFFLEGISYFKSRFYMIHPRTIADPEWGIKLTGKEGKNAIGFFTARDTITNMIIPSSQSSRIISLDQPNTSTAFRYRRDVGRSSYLGAVVTHRSGEDYSNTIAAFDGDVRFTKTHRFWFQGVASQTRYPGEVVETYNQPDGKFTGLAFDGAYHHTTKNVTVWIHYQDITPDFRADVGFVNQTGQRLYDIQTAYKWRRNPGHWYTQFEIRGLFYQVSDRDQLLNREYGAYVRYYGPLQSYIKITGTLGDRTYKGKEFRLNTVEFASYIRPSGNLFAAFYADYGDQVDYSNIQAGTRLRLNPFIQYNIGKHLYLELDHLYEKLNVSAGRLYSANLTNLSFIYQINRRTFLRTILQYADYKYNSDLYNNPRDPRYKHLFSQVLFSYKLNPKTVLFLGYSDDYYGYSAIPLKQNNRTFFMKIGYALVL